MATVSLWSNVGVTMQSVIGAALPITGITIASPGVVTSTAHGLVNGDYVLLVVSGMIQVDGRVFKVANKTNDTWEIEATTGYGTFVSGNAYKITFGTTLATLTELSATGGEAEMQRKTTIHDSQERLMPGVASAPVYSFTSQWDASDAGLVALKAASVAKTTRAFKFTFSNGQIVVFSGYVGCTLTPVGSSQAIVTTPVTISMDGAPTVYSS